MTNIGNMLHCVSKQIKRSERDAAISSFLATATETENVKPDHCAIKRVEKLEKDVFALFAQVLHLYRAEELMVSFNGGKDCTVLLDLVHSYFKRNKCISHIRLPVLYIEAEDGFEEVEAVVLDCERRYNINLIRRKGCIKEALTQILQEMPEIRAVLMGTRRTDPFCENLNTMQVTDLDWPSLMRINPLLDWSYRDIWYYTFVRQVPYCRLYENGYTSLGQKYNTQPNPHLRLFDPITKAVTYKHAAELEDSKYERAGRVRKDYVVDCVNEEEEESIEGETA
ncbi:PREDICTED: FAD synthase-like isoform X1 [Rhagoletis zephyria]|uniref:FAD synthase-like isoform X1 n=1 Tax=Rhagoletis zephyria TaxID=28612 RepID=UPI0008113CF8|nr:PREDICTED: FAD synthase-like isoform X1 [Rhagoletis zephyria]XP_017480707.1 PREDICTED: FAD synthase-like isoform X1 [Rhagoletis zephyria]